MKKAEMMKAVELLKEFREAGMAQKVAFEDLMHMRRHEEEDYLSVSRSRLEEAQECHDAAWDRLKEAEKSVDAFLSQMGFDLKHPDRRFWCC